MNAQKENLVLVYFAGLLGFYMVACGG